MLGIRRHGLRADRDLRQRGASRRGSGDHLHDRDHARRAGGELRRRRGPASVAVRHHDRLPQHGHGADGRLRRHLRRRPAPGLGETITCNLQPIDVLVPDAGCVVGTSPAAASRRACDDCRRGPATHYTVVTTKTVTTTPFSGRCPRALTWSSRRRPPRLRSTASAIRLPQAFPAQAAGRHRRLHGLAVRRRASPVHARQRELARRRRAVLLQDRPASARWPTTFRGGHSASRTTTRTHQHMTTFALALGVSGTLNYRADYRKPATVTGDFAEDPRRRPRTGRCGPIRRSTTSTPTTTTIRSRSTTSGTRRSTAAAGTSAPTIPRRSSQGCGDALAKIDDNQLASGTADGTSTLQPVAGNNFIYSTELPVGDVARRRRGAADRPRPRRRRAGGLVGASDLLDQRTFAACDDRKILRHARRQSTLGHFTWQTQTCARAACRPERR